MENLQRKTYMENDLRHHKNPKHTWMICKSWGWRCPHMLITLILFRILIDKIELVANEFKLLNIVVDVLLRFLIDNIEFVDNEFNFLNIVVDVAFGLLIHNVESVENEFKSLHIVVDVAFNLLIDNFELLIKGLNYQI